MKRISGKGILYSSLILSALFVLTYLLCAFHSYEEAKAIKVYINEVCTSNVHTLKDENGETPDYIELYNRGSEDIDLEGFKISKSREGGDSWEFPGIVMAPGEFIILYADGTESQIYPDEQYFSIRKYVMTGEGYIPSDTGMHLPFVLSSGGGNLYLTDPFDRIMDSVEIPPLEYDTVYAREGDGEGAFGRFEPTPGSTNLGAEKVVYPDLKSPVFSIENGFYEEGTPLSILSPDGGEIRYTLDGSEPDRDSLLYTGPIKLTDASKNENVYSAIRNASPYLYDYYNGKDYCIPPERIDKCNVVRAKVFSEDGRESECVTNSYFVGFKDKSMYDGMRVISLVADPEDLFGGEKGIYVLGDIGLERLQKRYEESDEAKAAIAEDPSLPLDGSVKIGNVGYNKNSKGNYLEHGIDWEREADIAYFSNDHSSVILDQSVGIRIKGNSSRQYPVKGFNIYARSAYSGKDRFDVPFFGDKGECRVSLSAGGNDWFTMTKDPFISEMVRRSGISVAAGRFSEPVYLFLNGEFWGTYLLAERLDENFFSREFGVKKDNVIFIKEGEVEAGRPDDIHYYYVFLSLYEDKDFSDEEEYREFCEAVDIESLMDYYALRFYSEFGIDWPHLNYGFWRVRNPEEGEYGDCKWRFVNFDNNVALNYNRIDTDMMDVLYNGSEFIGPDELFTALMENRGFRDEFLKRIRTVAEKIYLSEEAEETYRSISDSLRNPVSLSYKRWYGNNPLYNEAFFNEKTGEILRFIKEKINYIDVSLKP